MNQEYLWSKKGNDAEVERLEGLLADFRFDGNSAREQPASNIVSVAKVPKRRFVFGLSFAVTAAALVVMVIWVTRAPIVPVAKVEKSPEPVLETIRSSADGGLQPAVEDRGKNIASEARQTYVSRSTARNRPKANRESYAPRPAQVNLTKEEKYAYDRLMYALAIAGAKLKRVQDSVDRKAYAGAQTTRNEK